MNRHQALVRDFHQKFGHPAPEKLDVAIFMSHAKMRFKLIHEEFLETMGAAGFDLTNDLYDGFGPKRAPNVPEMIDGFVDLLYVTYGAIITLGIDIDPFFNAVHASNMAKLGPDGKPIVREDGKIMKPEGWQPPDIKAVLECVKRHEQALYCPPDIDCHECRSVHSL